MGSVPIGTSEKLKRLFKSWKMCCIYFSEKEMFLSAYKCDSWFFVAKSKHFDPSSCTNSKKILPEISIQSKYVSVCRFESKSFFRGALSYGELGDLSLSDDNMLSQSIFRMDRKLWRSLVGIVILCEEGCHSSFWSHIDNLGTVLFINKYLNLIFRNWHCIS